jgi:two-component system NarL family sensor kinase
MSQAGPSLVVPDVAALVDGPIKNTLLDRGIHALTALPLVVGAEALGFLQLGRAQTGPLPVDLLEFATQVADSLAVAVHDARLHDQLRDSRGQLQALARRRAERQETDRRYIADQLFNEAGQVVAALKLQLGRFERGPAQGPESAETLAEIKNSADRVLHDLHDLATRLRPISLDRLGLAAALNQYLVEFGQEHALQINFAAPGMTRVRVPDAIETALYRMTQEILANVAEHAAAEIVNVVLSRTDDLLLLSIADDGVGFDVASELRHGGLGLVGLIEQAEALGGALAIESAPGAGTTITARVPLAQGA